ncbi:cysteine-rich CWC family protein [Variovorax sp. LT1R16]|uniref:cysteine-rich CWC family protein n=1 Tax=Variovorax sp. LT1R16 TaxID=3443728 RepID=UPI003F4748A4
MPSLPSPDPTRCPLCGASNVCAMEIAKATGEVQPPCWCLSIDFDAAVLARIPAAARGQACICARCAVSADAQCGALPMPS